jgi:proteasome lid subunit RPN8/RPN11
MDKPTKPTGALPDVHRSVVAQPDSRVRTAAPHGRLTVSRSLLELTLAGLRDRSAGWRESGAIWAGHVTAAGEWTATSVYYHHELGDSAEALYLELSEAGKFRLYRELNNAGLRLIALLHTHPEDWVDLSPVDARNRLCPQVGFWSIIVPWYGARPWLLEAMGFHVRGERGWLTLDATQLHRLVRVLE